MLSLSSSLHPPSFLLPPSCPLWFSPFALSAFPPPPPSPLPPSVTPIWASEPVEEKPQQSWAPLLCLLMELREMRFEFPLTLCSICASLEPKKGPGLHNIIYCDAHLSNLKAFFKKNKINDHLAFFFLPLLLVHPIVFSVHLEAISCFYTG